MRKKQNDSSLNASDQSATLTINDISMNINDQSTLDEINQEIHEIGLQIDDLNKKRESYVILRKVKADEFIRKNELKAQDFSTFEAEIKARVEVELKARLEIERERWSEGARLEALNNPPPSPGDEDNIIIKYDPISLPKDSKYKIGDLIITHGGARVKKNINSSCSNNKRTRRHNIKDYDCKNMKGPQLR